MRALLIIISFSFCAQALSQSNALLRRQGEDAMIAQDFYAAEQYYHRLYARDSSDLFVMHAYADAARQAFDVDVSLRLFRKLVVYDNGDRYPLSIYWIGQLLKYRMQYKEAKKWFVKFARLPLKKEKYNYYKRKARLEADACDLAQKLVDNPTAEQVMHLDAQVNTRQSEYAASEHDSVLYFSSARMEKKESETAEPKQVSKLYRTDLKYGKPQRPRALDTSFNSANLHAANTAVSPDGKLMIFTKCVALNASDYRCELWQSRLNGRRWSTPEKLPSPLNIAGSTVTQPAFGRIGGRQVLFFASDRPGGHGGLDIWYAIPEDEEKWSEPVNVDHINTPDNEVTPWYDRRKDRLYFSSTYHPGLGGYDIFSTSYLNGEFTTPENAGYPVNSSFNDNYYSVSNLGHHVYLSSNRQGTLFENNRLNCCSDIWRFKADTARPKEPEPVKKVDSVVMKKDQMRLLVPLTLYFHNDEPDPRTTATVTTRNYESTYADYRKLRTTYVKEYRRGLKGREADMAENQVENFFGDSLDVGFESLNRFAALLKDVLLKGEQVKITLKGYCSPLATTDYNIRLARRRISSLRNYFVEKDGGWFVRYIGNNNPGEGRIDFEEVEVGELPVSAASDDLKDRRNSVYSPIAASERKIQIIAVSFGTR